MAITRAHDGIKSAGGTGAITITYAGVAAGRLALMGRNAWNNTATFTTESGFTLLSETTGGVNSLVDDHTARVRVAERILDGSETGTITPNQGGTVSGAIGVMPVYEHGGGGWDTRAATNGTDNTHGTGRSVTGAASLSFQPGDVLVCFVAVDTDSATAFSAKTLAAAGITFGGGTVTVHDSTTGGVATGNDGNIMVLEATVTAGTSTVAPTLTLTGGPSQCGPVIFVRLREIPLTSVSSDVDLRWTSRGQVTSDVDLRWRSAAQVSSDADFRWRSYVSVSSDVDVRWRSYVAITSDVDLRWRSRAQVTSDVDLRWTSRGQVTSDVDVRWRSRAQVTSDVDLRWRSHVVVTSDVDARWRVYAPVQNDVDARWRVWAPVTQDADLRWRTRVLVSSDVDARWRVYVPITSDVDLRWRVSSSFVSVSSDVDLRWLVYIPVSADADVRWLVYVPVTSDADLRWRTAVEVESDVDLRWRVEGGAQEVSALLDLRWIVAGVPGVADIIVTLGTPVVVVTLSAYDMIADLTPAGATIVTVDDAGVIVNLDTQTVEAPL